MIGTSTSRDFLDINALPPTEVQEIIALALHLKSLPQGSYRPLEGKTLALIFEKPSTRTRVSFEVGIRQLGGMATAMTAREMQLGQGETVSDTGKVLSRFVDLIMIRTAAHQTLLELAEGASVPVINGLTNFSHPCQIMADLLTATEKLGDLDGKKVAWLGDGNNNVITSFMHAAPIFGLDLRIICPPEFAPRKELMAECAHEDSKISVSDDLSVVEGADIVVTDCWVSMHDSDADIRAKKMRPYQVTKEIMGRASRSAIFMHCLPAHRGEEVTDDVLDGPQSVVFDEAENRLHVQKAIMLWCLGIDPR